MFATIKNSLAPYALALVVMGFCTLYVQTTFAQSQTRFSINEVQSVTETYHGGVTYNWDVYTVEVTLKNGKKIIFNNKFGLVATPKKVLEQFGYTGGANELAALKTTDTSVYTVSSVTNNQVSKRQILVTLNTSNYTYTPNIKVVNSAGKVMRTIGCRKTDNSYVCGQASVYNRNLDLPNGAYLVYATNIVGGLSNSMYVTVSETGIIRDSKILPFDRIQDEDAGFYQPTIVTAVSLRAGLIMDTLTFTVPNESVVDYMIVGSTSNFSYFGGKVKPKNSSTREFEANFREKLVENEAYTLFVRGFFNDGRNGKVLAAKVFTLKDGNLVFADAALNSAIKQTVVPTPVTPTVTPPASTGNTTFLPWVPTTVSGTGCTIKINEGSCVGTVTWTIDKSATEPRVVNETTKAAVSTGVHAQTGFWVGLTAGGTMFSTRNGNTALGSTYLTAACEAGSTSRNGICVSTAPTTAPVPAPAPVAVPSAPTVAPTTSQVPTTLFGIPRSSSVPVPVPPAAAPVVPTPVAPATPAVPVVPAAPAPVKSVQVDAGWSRCAAHGGTCVTRSGSDEAGVPVRYGVPGNYVTKTLKSNVMCHNAIFNARKAIPGATCEIATPAPAVRGASTDIYQQIHSTLSAIVTFLEKN
jgi:hypothetical protein